MIKNIIFDLGGVILDINFDKAASAFKKLGINDFASLYSHAAQSNLFINMELGIISDHEFYNEIRNISGINLSDEQIKVAWNKLLLDFPKERLMLLKEISKNYRCFLLSNTNKIHYDSYQENLVTNHNIDGLESLFEKCYFSHDIKLRKPNFKSFNYVLDKHSLKAEETLFIDDTSKNIAAAKGLGMETAFINTNKNDDILNLFENGILKANKPKIDTVYTSAVGLFKEEKEKIWDENSAPILVGIGINNPLNIGALIRLAGTVGCSKLILADDKKDHSISKIKRTATTGFKTVDWFFANLDDWDKHIPEDYSIIAMETTKDAKMIYDIKFPDKVAIVVGDESYGIYLDSLKKCNSQLFIPMNGPVKSLNVVQAAGISLYEVLRQKLTSY